jgi:large subunit ribosomal protein L29
MKLRDVKKELGKLRGMDADALKGQLVQLKKEEFNLRFQQATGQLEKTSRMRDVRRMIARIRAVIVEKTPQAKV